jgi:uncharacterized membrane protein
MMFTCLIGALFVTTAGVSMLLDGVDGNDEIGKFFTRSGALVALVLGVAMLRGAA